MCSACWFMVLYICEKFHQNIWNGFQLTEQTWVHGRNSYVQCSKSNNSKSRQIRVMLHMFCTPSQGALHLCKVWRNIFDCTRVMEWTWMMEALMDGWTDTQNFGRYNIIPSPLLVAGQNDIHVSVLVWWKTTVPTNNNTNTVKPQNSNIFRTMDICSRY